MKKNILLTAVLSAVLLSGSGIYAQEQGGGGQEIIIKGQLKIKIDTEKPDIEIKTDINEVADKVIKTEEHFLALSPDDIKNVRFGLPEKMRQQRADYSAKYDFFETGPVFSLKPRIEGVEIERWTFGVTDIAGQTAYRKRGTGRLPNEFIWDGFDENGKVLKLGSGYTYQLSFLTKAGVPETLRRKEPKTVDAIQYRRGGKLVLEVSNKKMFQASRKERLTPEGREILEEIMDYIKMSNKYPVGINVFSDDEGLAGDQIRTLKTILLRELKLPEKDIDFKGHRDKDVPQNRRVVITISG